MYTVDEKALEGKGKQLFTTLATARYFIGLAMAYWASKIFATLGYVYRQGMADNLTGINCLRCPSLLKDSAIALIIFGLILIAMRFIDYARDYLPAGIIWILSGLYFLSPQVQAYKKIVLGVYLLLFIWWIFERNKDTTRLLGHIQIFMPLSLAGVIFTDDITVWLFGVFIAIAFEGVYLAVQGASEISFAMLIGVENDLEKDRALPFMETLLKILEVQKILLWTFIALIMADAVVAFTKPSLSKYVLYGYLVLSLIYLLTWIWMGLGFYKVHKALGMSILISQSIIVLSLIVKFSFGNTFIAVIGILTGISVMSQVGPIYEYFVRKFTSAIRFDIYMDHTSIAMLFALLVVALRDPKASSIFISVSPFIVISIAVITKLLFAAFMLDTVMNTISNIKFGLERLEE